MGTHPRVSACVASISASCRPQEDPESGIDGVIGFEVCVTQADATIPALARSGRALRVSPRAAALLVSSSPCDSRNAWRHSFLSTLMVMVIAHMHPHARGDDNALAMRFLACLCFEMPLQAIILGPHQTAGTLCNVARKRRVDCSLIRFGRSRPDMKTLVDLPTDWSKPAQTLYTWSNSPNFAPTWSQPAQTRSKTARLLSKPGQTCSSPT